MPRPAPPPGPVSTAALLGHIGGVTPTGQALLEELRRQRRSGDPRISPEGREILARLVTGDLADQLADDLAAISAADPLLGGGPTSDDLGIAIHVAG